MKIHFRSLAALFALLAFSLFWAEGVWASMCSPGVGMDTATAMVADMGSDANACLVGTTIPSSGSEESRSDGPHCPLPMGVSSCTVGLPLAAESATPEVPALEGASLVGSPDHAKDLLLAVSLFHPPRA